MPEDTKQGEKPEETVEKQSNTTASVTTTANNDGKTVTNETWVPLTGTVEEKVEESAQELARKLQNKSEEAARLHKKVEKYEAEEAERKKQAMTETERLQAELEAAQKEAEQLKTRQAQRDAAEKVGLPLTFADRLKGATPEELEADAKQLLDSMPKQAAKPLKGMAPAEGEHKGMTDEERRQFLWG